MSTTCKDCNEDHAHNVEPGQRKVGCSACGYRSHWRRARVVGTTETGMFFVIDDLSREYATNGQHVGLKDLVNVRLTVCCYAPAEYDYKTAAKPPDTDRR